MSKLVPEIIYENENFLALNKPPGMLVEQVRAIGTIVPKNRELVLQGWLEKNFKESPQLVHRLDKETSGIILATKTQEYFDYFKDLFRERNIQKTYRALVYGEVKKNRGIIDAPIGIKQGMVRHTVHDTSKKMRPSITEYAVLTRYSFDNEEFTLLELYPKTGRTHQIRVHLNSIHHPVVGDKLYGGKKETDLAKRHLLHAHALEFSLKEGGRIKLEANFPNDFAHALKMLTSIE